jgi:acyl-CoA synthetase (AMP-forming)/AMP-acid ligase II
MAEVIVTGGEKVWPMTVEDAIRRYPGIADVAVAGRPDPEWGEVVVAWIVPVDAHDLPSLDGLRDHVRSLIPAYAAPRRLVFVKALPRTPLGKIQRKILPDTC